MKDDYDFRPTAMYRMYDAEGELLYVGISVRPDKRVEQHARDKAWFRGGEVEAVEVEWFDSRLRALEAEAVTIWQENPRYNLQRELPNAPKRHRRSHEVTSLADALGKL